MPVQVLVTDTSTFSSDIHAQGYDGLLGLGPNKASVIRKKLSDNVGDTALQRIFEANKDSPNYITFLLDRKNDPADPFTGQLTISEVVSGFENITSMPKLDVDTVNRLLQGGTPCSNVLSAAFHDPWKYQINIGRHLQMRTLALLGQMANRSSLTRLSLVLPKINSLPCLTRDSHLGGQVSEVTDFPN